MFTSEIDRLTIWPVCSWSCRAPSSLDSAANISVRRSCWTSSDSRPPRYRLVKTPAKLTSAAMTSAVAPIQIGWRWLRIALLTMSRWISGMITVTIVASSEPPSASSTRRG